MKTKLMALAALNLALPHINPKAIDGVRVQAEPIADCYVNTIVSTVIAALEADIAKTVEPTNEEFERVWDMHNGHPADFAADVLERWCGWSPGVLGYGGSLNVKQETLYTTPQEPAAAAIPEELLRVLADFEQYDEEADEFANMPTTGRIQLAANKARAMLAAAPGGAA